MKVILNKCFGGFNINETIAKKYGVDAYDESARYNKNIINLIESGTDCSGLFAQLEVVELPENTTDYEINDYDGFESIIYVVDGKIHHM